MRKPVRKAVFPVAGLGTRFLPVTKSVPKEMLPIVDKPIIQYAVEEALAAGINEIILVNHPQKQSIEKYFQRDRFLEDQLKSKKKEDLLESIDSLIETGLSVTTVFQNEPLGLGHAVLCARELINDEPFAVILPDDFIVAEKEGCIEQMIAVHEQYQCGVIAVEDVPRKDTLKYGIIETSALAQGICKINSIIEKPDPDQAPSTLAVVGRYILPSTIFNILEGIGEGSGGEIQLTDAIAELLNQQQVLSYEFKGTRYDCGSKEGYLMANVAVALQSPDINEDFIKYIQSF